MNILKWLSIPLLALATFLSYWLLLILLANLIPLPEDMHYKTALMIQLMLPSLFASIGVVSLFSFFLVKIYRQNAILVSIVLALPVIIVSTPALSTINTHDNGFLFTLIENLLFLFLMILGTSLAQKISNRTKTTLNNTELTYALRQYS